MLGIGKPRQAQDVVDLLLECHERIRGFTALARRLGGAAGVADAEVADAAAKVRRYFVEALPLHAADEEESLLPRLRGRDPAVDRELEAMHREHDEHQAILGRVVALCDALAADPSRHRELGPALAEAAGALERHFEAHLAREEEVIFPAVRRELGDSERARIAEELRARRQRPA
jgi:iron-sulfur cluster repair protein YtfE (RIC family)